MSVRNSICHYLPLNDFGCCSKICRSTAQASFTTRSA